jgi:hypothetical protein
MSDTIEVREARRDDRLAIRDLLSALLPSLATQRGGAELIQSGALTPDRPGWMTLIGASPDALLVVGFLSVQSTAGSTRGRLELLHSKDSATSEAISALVSFAQVLLRDRGAGALDIVSLPGDQVLKSSLEEQGFRARLLVMARDL